MASDRSSALLEPFLPTSPLTLQDSVLAQSGFRFYGRSALTTRRGLHIRAICVLGNEPRDTSTTLHESEVLKDLAAHGPWTDLNIQSALWHGLAPLTDLAKSAAKFAVELQRTMSREQQPTPVYGACSVEVVDVAISMGSLQRGDGPSYNGEWPALRPPCLGTSLPGGGRVYHLGPCQFFFSFSCSLVDC